MKKHILFSILLPLSFIINAQKPKLIFKKTKNQVGRTISNIKDIKQDKIGFLWLTNSNGILHRYDGYTFKNFYETNDSLRIPFISLSGLFFDKNNRMFVGDENKIYTYTDGIFDNKSFLSNQLKTIPNFKKMIETSKFYWFYNYGIGYDLYKYDKKLKTLKHYNIFYNSYSPTMFSIFNKVTKKHSPICEITKIKNFEDTFKVFSIEKPTEIIISSIGEGSSYEGLVDYAILLKGNDTIWKMNYLKTKHAGGNKKNRIEFFQLKLEQGNYHLKYISDGSHSFDNWNAKKPDKLNYYGIKIYEINKKTKKNITNNILKSYIDTSSLQDDVRDFVLNNDSNLCILTNSVLSIYNEQKDNFTNYNLDILKDTSRFKGIQKSNYTNNPMAENIISLPNDDNLYINTSFGILMFNIKNGVFKTVTYPDFNGKHSRSSMNIYKGEILILRINDLPLIFNTRTLKFTICKNRRFNNIYTDANNNIWAISWGNVYKSFKEKIHKTRFNNRLRFSNRHPCFIKDSVFLYFQENKTTGSSISKINLINQGKVNYSINSILKANNTGDIQSVIAVTENCIVLAIKNKLYSINEKNKNVTNILSIKNKIIDIKEIKKNNILILTNKLTYLYNLSTNNITDSFEINNNNEKIDDFLWLNNDLFLRTNKAVYLINTTPLKIKKILDFKLHTDKIYSGNLLFEENNIWTVNKNILYKIKPNKPNITKYNLFPDKLLYYTKNEPTYSKIIFLNDKYWISTTKGLICFDSKTHIIKKYNHNNGMLGNNVFNFSKDSSGFLWIATEEGISKFNIHKESFINYNTDRPFSSMWPTQSSLKDHSILFFSNFSYYKINPNDINKTPPPIIITKFELFNKEFILDSAIYVKKKINLNYDQNSISFEFSALDYSDPKRNQYAYMLEGVEKDWIYTDYKDRKAKYTNLSPGKYTFRVKASNNDGIWNEKGISLKIIIKPPFWKTWWFYTLEVLFGLFLLYLFIKFREKKLRKENENLEQIVAQRTIKLKEQNTEIETQKEEIQSIADNLIVSNKAVTKQKEEIEEIHKHTTDSIQYASRIQQAILPPNDLIEKHLPEHFILFKPRDVVSGDFYWLKQIGNYTVYAAADCTGHGVPGAFMSMLGISFLNEIVTKTRFDNPGEVLNRLRKKIKTSLRQTDEKSESKDGMDIALCVIDHENLILEYSGAYNPVYILREKELFEIKATRNPIGIYFNEKPFENHEFQLQKGDVIYTFSDGYVDQFGGENESKFKTRNFKKLLAKIYDKPMKEQEEILENILIKWQGENEQTDDIIVFGVKI